VMSKLLNTTVQWDTAMIIGWIAVIVAFGVSKLAEAPTATAAAMTAPLSAPLSTPTLAVVPECKSDSTTDTPTVDEMKRFITQTALEMQVDPQLALEIARTESGYRPHAVHVERDRSVSLGVFQLGPRTAKVLGVDDPLEWRQNVIGGVGYLGRLTAKYGGGAAGVEKVKCAWVNGEWSKVCK